MSEEIDALIESSDSEFNEQKDLAAKRIDHVKLIQDKLLNHIATIESINQLFEQKIKTLQGDERIRMAKTLSYNYDKLIKLYEVYQSYEQVVNRYHTHLTDTINKKYQININFLKSSSPSDIDPSGFFRKLNGYLSGENKEEIDNLAKIDDPKFNL